MFGVGDRKGSGVVREEGVWEDVVRVIEGRESGKESVRK